MDGADEVTAAGFRTEARRRLAALGADIGRRHPDLDVTTELLLDDPADGLVAAAGASELLVLGSRGIGGFRGLLVGSVGLATAARAEVPTVLVRAGEQVVGAAGGASEIVVGLDTRAPAAAVLDFAFREAALRGAGVRVVHGWNLPPTYGYAGWVAPETELRELGALEAKLLAEAVEDWRERFPGIEVSEEARPGGAAHAVVAASERAALVVVGRRTNPHWRAPHLGPVAHAVIHHAKAPTAVIPHL
jgi:nucleotide-binding universal stress UspA family protein